MIRLHACSKFHLCILIFLLVISAEASIIAYLRSPVQGGRRGFAVGMAADEAGRWRYIHNELTQRRNEELLCKSWYKVLLPRKGIYWRGGKIMIMVTVKNFLGPRNNPAFSLSVNLQEKNILYLFIFWKPTIPPLVHSKTGALVTCWIESIVA